MKKQYLCIVKNIKMQITSNTGLVLEGGGMRGVFTSGVLDAFMKHEVYFPYVVAVSAGACNGLSYMSHQPRRARWSNIDMLQKYDYISLKSLIVNGSIFDPELIYERFPNEFFPFDYDAYEKNPATFEVVTTNCRTGRAMYLTERHDHRRLTQLIRATSSLPFVAHITRVYRYRASGECGGDDAQSRLSFFRTRYQDSQVPIRRISPSESGIEPPYGSIQQTARTGRAHGGLGRDSRYPSPKAIGSRAYHGRCCQVGTSV